MATDDDLLKQAITTLNAGRRKEARRLLVEIVERDRHNEMAWLWLSGAVDTDEERRACLENVLAINPSNGIAQRGLEALRKSSPDAFGPDDVSHRSKATSQPIGKASIKSQSTSIREQVATDEINTILQQAIAAIKSGEQEKGKRLLLEVIEQDGNNEAAWLWMARCVADRSVKRECFEHVLEINPDNQLARKGLRQLDTLGKARSSPTTIPRAKRPKKSSRTRTILILCAFIAVGCCALMMLPRSPSPPCDLGDALTFDGRFSFDHDHVAYSITLLIEGRTARTSSSIQEGLAEAVALRSMLDDQDLIPVCYDTILADSLRHDKLALDHFIEAYHALAISDISRAQAEYSTGIDEYEAAGESFLVAICVYDISSLHAGYSRTCDQWRNWRNSEQ